MNRTRRIIHKSLVSTYLAFTILLLSDAVPVRAGEKYPKFGIRLSGEVGIMAIGDINTGLSTFNDNLVFEYIRKNNPDWGRVEGAIDTLKNSFGSGEFELRIDLSRRIGLGISSATGLRRQNESSLTYFFVTDVTWPYEYYYKPAIWASTPLRMTLYCYLRPGSRFSSYLSGGIGYYRGGIKEQFNLTVINGYSGDVGWGRRYWETQTKGALGFHVGQGMELLLSRNLALTGEIQWRYVRISNFGAFQRYETTNPSYEESTGYLYYFTKENLFVGVRHADLTVWEVPPEYSIEFIMDVRKARLDLTGLSLKVGLRIMLF
jgi:opacity protein-like surface antigen